MTSPRKNPQVRCGDSTHQFHLKGRETKTRFMVIAHRITHRSVGKGRGQVKF
jgi:hypothetical protein